MTRYVALLRGINVSGQKIIPMKDLQRIMSELPIENVATYIQSGNIIFDSSVKKIATLETTIEKHLHKALGYNVTTIARTMESLQKIVESDPFSKKHSSKESKPYVTFMKSAPSIPLVIPYRSKKEDVTIVHANGNDLFCLSHPLGNGRWGFPNLIVETELQVEATTRNWNTVSTIVSKYGA